MTVDDITDTVEQFLDGEAVAPEALVSALATLDGREHLRGLLELRALVAETTPVGPRHAAVASSPFGWPTAFRIAAAAILTVTAAAGGYVAGTHGFGAAPRNTSVALVEHVPDAPAPTTVIKLDATTGWQDQIGGF